MLQGPIFPLGKPSPNSRSSILGKYPVSFGCITGYCRILLLPPSLFATQVRADLSQRRGGVEPPLSGTGVCRTATRRRRNPLSGTGVCQLSYLFVARARARIPVLPHTAFPSVLVAWICFVPLTQCEFMVKSINPCRPNTPERWFKLLDNKS